MSTPLSLCVLACDEGEQLERCLLAAGKIADEIIVVVDGKSGDATEEIARRLASRVEVRSYAGDIDQKRYCVSLAKHDWVFVLDPDEVVPPALANSILGALAQEERAERSEGSSPSAYRVNRATYHLGSWIRFGDFYPDWKVRIFRRSQARFVGRDPHGRIEVDGKVEDLSPDLEHYSYRDLSDQVDRIQFFSTEAAKALVADDIPFRLRRLLFHPPGRFLRGYLLRQGYRDGLAGFVIAMASAFYVFLKYAKHWEHSRSRPDSPA